MFAGSDRPPYGGRLKGIKSTYGGQIVLTDLTALAQTDLGGHLDYVTRNLIEKWSQTLKMRVERFHNTLMGSRASAARWLAPFAFYYNYQRPNQALDNRTPVKAVKNS